MKKIKTLLSLLIMLLVSGGVAYAVVQTINSDGSQNQTITGGSNISVTNNGNGTNKVSFVSSFTDGSILFSSGASLSQDNSNLFWDDTNNRLGVGTSTPSERVEVNGTVKASQVTTNTVSATGTNQSLYLNPTGTGEVVIGGDSIVVASKSNEPSSPKTGQIYFDTILSKFRGYNGTTWQDLTASQLDTSVELESSSGHYLSISDANQNGLKMTNAFSIEMWAKFESLPSSGTAFALAGKMNSSVGSNFGYIFLLANSSGTPKLWTWLSPSSGTANSYSTNWTPSLNTWYHVAITWDGPGTTLKYYVNGAQQGSDLTTTESSLYTGGTAPFTIGIDGDLTSTIFDGKLDEIRIWNDVRTSTELVNNKDIELTGNESNLQGYWKMNNNFIDTTSNNNDLSAFGPPSFSTDKPF